MQQYHTAAPNAPQHAYQPSSYGTNPSVQAAPGQWLPQQGVRPPGQRWRQSQISTPTMIQPQYGDPPPTNQYGNINAVQPAKPFAAAPGQAVGLGIQQGGSMPGQSAPPSAQGVYTQAPLPGYQQQYACSQPATMTQHQYPQRPVQQSHVASAPFQSSQQATPAQNVGQTYYPPPQHASSYRKSSSGISTNSMVQAIPNQQQHQLPPAQYNASSHIVQSSTQAVNAQGYSAQPNSWYHQQNMVPTSMPQSAPVNAMQSSHQQTTAPVLTQQQMASRPAYNHGQPQHTSGAPSTPQPYSQGTGPHSGHSQVPPPPVSNMTQMQNSSAMQSPVIHAPRPVYGQLQGGSHSPASAVAEPTPISGTSAQTQQQRIPSNHHRTVENANLQQSSSVTKNKFQSPTTTGTTSTPISPQSAETPVPPQAPTTTFSNFTGAPSDWEYLSPTSEDPADAPTGAGTPPRSDVVELPANSTPTIAARKRADSTGATGVSSLSENWPSPSAAPLQLDRPVSALFAEGSSLVGQCVPTPPVPELPAPEHHDLTVTDSEPSLDPPSYSFAIDAPASEANIARLPNEAPDSVAGASASFIVDDGSYAPPSHASNRNLPSRAPDQSSTTVNSRSCPDNSQPTPREIQQDLDPWCQVSLERYKQTLILESAAEAVDEKISVFLDFMRAELSARGIQPSALVGSVKKTTDDLPMSQEDAVQKSDKYANATVPNARPGRPRPSPVPSTDSYVLVDQEIEEYSPGGRPMIRRPIIQSPDGTTVRDRPAGDVRFEETVGRYSPGGRPIVAPPSSQFRRTSLKDKITEKQNIPTDKGTPPAVQSPPLVLGGGEHAPEVVTSQVMQTDARASSMAATSHSHPSRPPIHPRESLQSAYKPYRFSVLGAPADSTIAGAIEIARSCEGVAVPAKSNNDRKGSDDVPYKPYIHNGEQSNQTHGGRPANRERSSTGTVPRKPGHEMFLEEQVEAAESITHRVLPEEGKSAHRMSLSKSKPSVVTIPPASPSTPGRQDQKELFIHPRDSEPGETKAISPPPNLPRPLSIALASGSAPGDNAGQKGLPVVAPLAVGKKAKCTPPPSSSPTKLVTPPTSFDDILLNQSGAMRPTALQPDESARAASPKASGANAELPPAFQTLRSFLTYRAEPRSREMDEVQSVIPETTHPQLGPIRELLVSYPKLKDPSELLDHIIASKAIADKQMERKMVTPNHRSMKEEFDEWTWHIFDIAFAKLQEEVRALVEGFIAAANCVRAVSSEPAASPQQRNHPQTLPNAITDGITSPSMIDAMALVIALHNTIEQRHAAVVELVKRRDDKYKAIQISAARPRKEKLEQHFDVQQRKSELQAIRDKEERVRKTMQVLDMALDKGLSGIDDDRDNMLSALEKLGRDLRVRVELKDQAPRESAESLLRETKTLLRMLTEVSAQLLRMHANFEKELNVAEYEVSRAKVRVNGDDVEKLKGLKEEKDKEDRALGEENERRVQAVAEDGEEALGLLTSVARSLGLELERKGDWLHTAGEGMPVPPTIPS